LASSRLSDISAVSFFSLRNEDSSSRRISEGVILKTAIYGEDALYQVVNGNTREEHLQALGSHGYTVGIARKLGRYNPDESERETRKWMPSIYSPLFFRLGGDVTRARIKEIAGRAIGRLPDTDFEVRLKDLDAVVTHNTALLGILGIGKSCLAYDLIKRVSAEGIKVVCIDLTNEYRKELPSYVPDAAVSSDDENAFNSINARFDYVHADGQKQVPDRSGNFRDYRAAVHQDLCRFLSSTRTATWCLRHRWPPMATVTFLRVRSTSKQAEAALRRCMTLLVE
jgi:hypothetical protein